jgi:glutathione synthase/RimK-type ligase-like ATP-grasp enzyme
MSTTSQKKPLKLVIFYQHEKPPLKKKDSDILAEKLTAMGHEVTLIDADKVKILTSDSGDKLEYEGGVIDIASFDGGMFRASGPRYVPLANALDKNGVITYQSYPSLLTGTDKIGCKRTFDANGIPTPKSLAIAHNEGPDGLNGFLNELGQGPYVVKQAIGYSG